MLREASKIFSNEEALFHLDDQYVEVKNFIGHPNLMKQAREFKSFWLSSNVSSATVVLSGLRNISIAGGIGSSGYSVQHGLLKTLQAYREQYPDNQFISRDLEQHLLLVRRRFRDMGRTK